MNQPHQTTYRILDASANRATEGIRTIEEFVRFALDDSVASAAAKSLRHDLASALGRLDRTLLLSARDTESDVGTAIETQSEYQRAQTADVITAAAERVQQSLRVLEEYGKTIDVEFARQVETLRYRAYTLHSQIELKARRLKARRLKARRLKARQSTRHRRLADSVLYLLIDCKQDEATFTSAISDFALAGVDIFQLRDKQATDRMLYERAKLGVSIARDRGALLIVNDRADIALSADADGVHVGQDELTATAVRQIIGSDRLVGVSTHNIAQVHQAIAEGADYIGCGPTFPSTTKSFREHAGTRFLEQVHRETGETPRPAFAIGGITSNNVDQVTASGFHRIAVTAAINNADDPVAATQELRKLLPSKPSVA